MNLVTPDIGLLFWMVVIFGIVFFLLAKFGFPIITDSLRNRNARIQKSLDDAQEIETRMAAWKQEHAEMMEETRREQAAILREAAAAKAQIVADAKAQAQEEAEKILAKARTEIAAEKESALQDVRKEVALLGVQVAEKILRHELEDTGSQRAFLDQLVDEASKAQMIS